MHPSTPFTLALLQLPANPDGGDRLPQAVAAIRQVASEPRRGGLICVLPELFRAPYFCQTMDPEQFDLAEPIPGPATAALQSLAAELQVVIVASLFEKIADGLYANTTAVIDVDGRLAGTYRKSHIPCDPQYEEKFYFAPGDTGFQVIDTAVARLGVLICWDQWYPEAARLTAMQGAEVLLYPTAIGAIDTETPGSWKPGRRSSAVTRSPTAFLSPRSIAAAANRVRTAASIFGATASAQALRASGWRAPAVKPPPSASNATAAAWSRSGAGGRSFATAASTSTAASPSAGSRAPRTQNDGS
jgi:N-carbamoylputrescine amidase